MGFFGIAGVRQGLLEYGEMGGARSAVAVAAYLE